MIGGVAARRRIDIAQTASQISGLLAIGVLDISAIVALIWALRSYPALRTAIGIIFTFFIIVGIILRAIINAGRDEYDS